MLAPTAASVPSAAIDILDDADRLCARALIGQFRRVLDEQDRPLAIVVTGARGCEVAAQNIAFLNALVSEEAVSRFRARPVLTRKRNAAAHAVTDLPQQFAKSSAKAGVFESAFVDLAF
jgi:hypothetical protein